MNEKDQPKDYVPITIDEAIDEAYKVSPWHIKVLFQMQVHPFLTALVYLIIGYIFGVIGSKI